MTEQNAYDWRCEYPFASHHLEMPYGVRMHYVDEPARVAGEPRFRSDAPCIVAVHGNPTWSFYYRALVESMSKTHRVLAVDHIGCGLSSKPQQYDYCLETHTDNLVRWIEALDLERIVMVVHDWGGAIGLGAALRCQERIAGLVVLNTAAFPPPYVPWRIAACRLPWVGSWAIRHLNGFAKAATVMAIHRLKRLSPTACAGLLAPYDSPMNRIGIDTFVKDIPLSPLHRSYRTLQLSELNLPALRDLPIRLVWGMKDWCFRPECLRRFEAMWPQAITRELVDVGHYVMEDAPCEVIEQVQALCEGLD